VDAIKAASSGHHFLSVTKQGISAIVSTCGNSACHVILRGGADGPNYAKEFVKQTRQVLEKSKVCPRIMIDCSHGNSQKDHNRQKLVIDDICYQLMNEETSGAIMGVMIESHLVEGVFFNTS
jgi:3-deoxy-7-phosphoheptulonate synthase